MFSNTRIDEYGDCYVFVTTPTVMSANGKWVLEAHHALMEEVLYDENGILLGVANTVPFLGDV